MDDLPTIGKVVQREAWEYIDVATVQRWGKSLAVRLPFEACNISGVKPGDKIRLAWGKLREANEEERAMRKLRQQIMNSARGKKKEVVV